MRMQTILLAGLLTATALGGAQAQSTNIVVNGRPVSREMGMPTVLGVDRYAEYVEKFGWNTDLDTTVETIWDYGGVYAYPATTETLQVSSSNATDTHEVTIQGIDADWDLQTVTVDLTTQTAKAVPGVWRRVFRAYNSDSSDLGGDVYAYVTGTTLSSGVPQTAGNVRMMIDSSSVLKNNQTNMAVYTIPDGYVGYLSSWYLGAGKDDDVLAFLQARLEGKAFRTIQTQQLEDGQLEYHFDVPLRYAARTDFRVQAKSTAQNSITHSGFHIRLVPE